MNNRIIFSAVALVASFTLSACETPVVDTTDRTPIRIPTGTLKNPELTIRAIDGSFTLEGGERFETPFSVHTWGSKSNCSSIDTLVGDDLAELYPAALACGAKPVEILREEEEPLYGVLLLNSAISSASGPASRSHLIEVSDSAISRAEGGGISVVFARVPWSWTMSDGRSGDKTWASWFLWISSARLD